MRALSAQENKQVSGRGELATGLAMGAAVLGVAGQVARFVPGAQVLAVGMSVLGIGVGALAGVAVSAGL